MSDHEREAGAGLPPSPSAPLEGRKPPIFVVGCQRSGTTLFRLILDSHPDISCGPETRFLADLERITDDENWPRMKLYGFPKEWWYARAAELFDRFQREYAAGRGKTRWADKTPMYARHLAYIDHLFPDALVINLIRDGRDVVRSHRDTWGYTSSLKAIEKWPRYVEEAQTFGARVGPERYLEVRYEDLVGDTRATMERVLGFVDEPWSDEVLRHTEHTHDVMPRYDKYTANRREGKQAAVYSSRVGGGKKVNDPMIKALIKWRAGATLKKLGYE